jgi:hypothetical protein
MPSGKPARALRAPATPHPLDKLIESAASATNDPDVREWLQAMRDAEAVEVRAGEPTAKVSTSNGCGPPAGRDFAGGRLIEPTRANARHRHHV